MLFTHTHIYTILSFGASQIIVVSVLFYVQHFIMYIDSFKKKYITTTLFKE